MMTAPHHLQPLSSRAYGAAATCCLQAQRLEELQESLAVPYDGDNLQHQQQLQELWALAFPALPFPASIKSNQWKDMGWQVGPAVTQMVQLSGAVGTVRMHPCSVLPQQLGPPVRLVNNEAPCSSMLDWLIVRVPVCVPVCVCRVMTLVVTSGVLACMAWTT